VKEGTERFRFLSGVGRGGGASSETKSARAIKKRRKKGRCRTTAVTERKLNRGRQGHLARFAKGVNNSYKKRKGTRDRGLFNEATSDIGIMGTQHLEEGHNAWSGHSQNSCSLHTGNETDGGGGKL